MKPRATSITGGLPYLLLSVIPPIIPRASWPSAEYMHGGPMRKSVTFASQGHLVGQSSDIRKLHLAHQQATGKTGIIERIRGIFSRTTTVDSSASLNLGETNNNNSSNTNSNNSNQKKTSLKSHKGLFTRLVPSSVSVSCNALAKAGQQTQSIVRVPSEPEIPSIGKYIKPPESRVNFSLPISRRPSNAFQAPTLRERTKCSPRFPHRVVPTCSLSALEESSDDKSLSVSPKDPPRISLNQSYTNGKWKSMDSPNYPGTNFNFETLR